MSEDLSKIIYSSRELDSSVKKVYSAFSNPLHLKNWWGPAGFSNTIHEFDLRPQGRWILTMHGPEKGNYENSSVFKEVVPHQFISWRRISQPIFEMEIGLEKLSDFKTRISFKMIFDTVEECEKVKRFAIPKNEENFDRLEKELQEMK